MDPRLIAGLALVVIAACAIIPFLHARGKALAAFLPVLFNAAITTWLAIDSLNGQETDLKLYAGAVMDTVLIRIDPLSAWFIILINIVVVSAAWYGQKYMQPYSSRRSSLSVHWISFIFFHFSMLLVCMVQHSIAFLIAWELMTLSSFLLIIFDHHRFATVNAGLNYLVQMHLGVSLLTLAFLWVAVSSGDYSFDAIRAALSAPEGRWLFVLFFAGFAFKAGFIPLHTWLPHAHPAAPSHVSGAMSAVMTKIGIFGILRISGLLSHDFLMPGSAILVISVLTALYGIFNAAINRDYKRVLAFSTIENIGIAGMGIGLGLIGKGTGNTGLAVIGFSATLLHVFNHSLYKSLLFFAAGDLYNQTHSRNMEQLGGLTKKLPVTSFFFLCGALAICGFPPFNGFISKFALFSGMFEGIRSGNFQRSILMVSAVAGLAVTSGLALFTFARMYGVIFLGSRRTEETHPPAERLAPSHIPFVIILILILVAGLLPRTVWLPAEDVARRILLEQFSLNPVQESTVIFPAATGLAPLMFITVLAATWLIRSRVMRRATIRYAPTWNCGYAGSTPKMQYTGNSFSMTLASMFRVLAPEEEKFSGIRPDTVFPSARTFRSTVGDFFEKRIFKRITASIFIILNLFSFFQRGRIQVYILYGLIFILLLITGTLLHLL